MAEVDQPKLDGTVEKSTASQTTSSLTNYVGPIAHTSTVSVIELIPSQIGAIHIGGMCV